MTDNEGKILGKINVRGLDATHLVNSDPVLLQCSFIRALGDSAEAVLARSRVCRLKADGVAFLAGQPAGSVMLVISGELSVRGEDDAEAMVGGPVPVGEITGAEAALGEATRITTATAAGEAVVVDVPVEAFAGLLLEGSPLAECLIAAQQRDQRAASDMADFLDRW